MEEEVKEVAILEAGRDGTSERAVKLHKLDVYRSAVDEGKLTHPHSITLVHPAQQCHCSAPSVLAPQLL